MSEVGRSVSNTIGKAPITFAMIELADSADCNARKSQWLAYGFKDITPLYGTQSKVPSLDGAKAAQGREMLKQMAGIAADWYMVSGHHGAIYAADYANFTPPGVPFDHANIDTARLYDEEEYCGFFNEAYHALYWEHAKRDNHIVPASAAAVAKTAAANAIYVRTTESAPSDVAATDQDNPIFDATAGPLSNPNGIIISACNTLAYKHARRTWSGYFPNAVFIGAMSWIVTGTWVTTAIAGAAMTNEAFWRNPQSILDQSGMPEKLSQQLTSNFPSSSQIGMMYKGNLYTSGNSSAAY